MSASYNQYDDKSAAVLLERAYEMAGGPLAGVEDAANELAQLAGDSVTISIARRIVLDRVGAVGAPSDK